MEKSTVASPKFFVPRAPAAAVVDVRGVFSALWRRWPLIAVSILVFGLLGALVAFILPARYVATTEVFIDPRNLAVLQNELNPTNGTGDELSLLSQSQVQMVRSTEVLTRVVHAERLASDPDFGAPEPGLLEIMKTALLGPPDKTRGETPELKAIRALDHELTVRRTDKTFVFEIGVKTGDPDKSARIANAVAAAFIKELGRARAAEVRQSGGALDARLSELRRRLRESDDAIEHYRRSHDLIGAGGRLVSDQELSDLTAQLASAQRHVAEAGSRLEQIKHIGRDGDISGDMTEAVQSTALAAIRATLAQAKRAAAESAVTYGPRFPATRELAARVQTARQQLDAELTRINRSAATDYQRARNTEAKLTQQIAALKEKSGTANEASVQLRELEREAGSNRAVYEAFLNRTKDLQERLYLDTVNAHVVKVAMPPLVRAGLSRTMITAIGLMLGLLIGLTTALLREQAEVSDESDLVFDPRL